MGWFDRRRGRPSFKKRDHERKVVHKNEPPKKPSPVSMPPVKTPPEPPKVEFGTLSGTTEERLKSYLGVLVPTFYGDVILNCNLLNDSMFGGRKVLVPSLILAIIFAESQGNTYAVRYEPGFFKWLMTKVTGRTIRVNKHLISRQTEEVMRSTSFGLMQIMGQTARELGYQGVFLTQLTNSATNIRYGCKYLASRIKLFSKKEDYIAAYNSGSPKYRNGKLINEDYVVKIHKYQALIQRELNK